MIHNPVKQGSPEWFLARMGIPTASCFDKILTAVKGDLSKSCTGYINQLIGERFTKAAYPEGPPWGLETYQNAAMRWGTECEAQARSWYAMTYDIDIEECGLCRTDDGRFGASPDFLVGAEGIGELKCPTPTVMIEWLLAGKLPDDHKVQVHGELAVTGRKWCDFIAYCPAVPKKLVVRVEPTEYTAKLRTALELFDTQLRETEARIRGMQ